MAVGYDDDQLKISHAEADLVLRSEVYDDEIGPSKRGNDRIMFVGFGFDADLLEVGVEYIEQTDGTILELVFHGMKATAKYQKFYWDWFGI